MKLNHPKFNPGHERFRATFSAADFAAGSRFGEIDEAAGILKNVQINVMGEAKGHGVFLGEDFVDAVVAQGNSAQLGIKVRFGHPNMCADALGTFLGRAKNFSKQAVTRPDGTAAHGAFAEIHLAEEAKDAPSGDLYTWTLTAAKNNPDTFGQSIVFTYADFYVLDADGNKHLLSEQGTDSPDEDPYDTWIKKSVDGKRYAVLDKLLGTDFTDTPAATDGVFSADDLAAQATQMLDENPRILELLTSKPDTVAQFLTRYNAAQTAAGKPELRLSIANDPALEKRLSGLQAAKDKELAQLRADFDAFKAAAADQLAAHLAAKDEEIARLTSAAALAHTDFTSQLAALQTGLDSAKAELSAAHEETAKTAKALADTGKQLEAAKLAHAKLTGAVLTSQTDFADWKAAEKEIGYSAARKQYPELYAAFMGGR